MICANHECGKEFIPHIRNPHQKYCKDSECKKQRKKLEYTKYESARIKRYNKERIFINLPESKKIKTCFCGKVFKIDMITIRKIYCSLKCQRRYIARSRRKKPNNIKQNAIRYALNESKNITDRYVRIIISQRTDIDKYKIPQELIEEKRLTLKIKRKIKQLSQ